MRRLNFLLCRSTFYGETLKPAAWALDPTFQNILASILTKQIVKPIWKNVCSHMFKHEICLRLLRTYVSLKRMKYADSCQAHYSSKQLRCAGQAPALNIHFPINPY